MVVGAKVCELTDGFLWFACGNFDISPKAVSPRSRKTPLLSITISQNPTCGIFHKSGYVERNTFK